MIFEYPLLIIERHLDTFGHVNNATYMEIFEEARWDVIERRGYGLAKIKATGQGPVVLEANLKFLRELHLRVNIIVKTELASYEGRVMKLHQWIEGQDGTIHCDALMTMAFFDTRTRKIIAPNADWLHAVGAN